MYLAVCAQPDEPLGAVSADDGLVLVEAGVVADVSLAQADAEPFGEQGGGAAQPLGLDGEAAFGAGCDGRSGDGVAVAPGVEDAFELAVAGEQVVEDALLPADGLPREMRTKSA